MKRIISLMTFWKIIGVCILLAGAVATTIRFTKGLGASTNLSDEFPWGIWIGFDILCGVGLAAGGFTLVAIVHIFNIKRFEPILRPTILTAFLGYLLVIVALMFDLGRPLQIWHAIIMWNPHSVMFEVAWCVMLYTTVLALEFSPVLLEKFGMPRLLKAIRHISPVLIIVGVILSTLHQSSLGSLYLIVPEKLYALWYSPYLPVFFYLSAISVGCAMIIFESILSARVFHKGLELPLLVDIVRFGMVILAVLLTAKISDLASRNALHLLFLPRPETYFYWLEIGIGILLPLIILGFPKVRTSRGGLFTGSILVILGFIFNRLNISITGMEAWAGISYFPSWMEIMVTLAIVTAGFFIFSAAAKHLPLFSHEELPHSAGKKIDLNEDLRQVSQLTTLETGYAALTRE
ncbi:MAG TPA: Ni/Fe-hydrogenase cytochrome b subunit [Bacteroidota bacterium]|jgi:Ni/Fe-hydrogenase subunit HybB-like protein|nr:Ni/Fe-hydrogenase cytochrome b subunit [Bacteroidota bacterium]